VKRPIRIDGDIAYVTLTKGYEAVIDASDVHLVREFSWYVLVAPRTAYARCKDGEKTLYMHRVIVGSVPDGMEIDHRDLDGLNNRRHNLRIATTAQNQYNRRPRFNFKGVSWNKERKMWYAQIYVNKKQHHLGAFSTPEAAHAAYAAASVELHGDFGRCA
jgi:hypothetical protein